MSYERFKQVLIKRTKDRFEERIEEVTGGQKSEDDLVLDDKNYFYIHWPLGTKKPKGIIIKKTYLLVSDLTYEFVDDGVYVYGRFIDGVDCSQALPMYAYLYNLYYGFEIFKPPYQPTIPLWKKVGGGESRNDYCKILKYLWPIYALHYMFYLRTFEYTIHQRMANNQSLIFKDYMYTIGDERGIRNRIEVGSKYDLIIPENICTRVLDGDLFGIGICGEGVGGRWQITSDLTYFFGKIYTLDEKKLDKIGIKATVPLCDSFCTIDEFQDYYVSESSNADNHDETNPYLFNWHSVVGSCTVTKDTIREIHDRLNIYICYGMKTGVLIASPRRLEEVNNPRIIGNPRWVLLYKYFGQVFYEWAELVLNTKRYRPNITEINPVVFLDVYYLNGLFGEDYKILWQEIPYIKYFKFLDAPNKYSCIYGGIEWIETVDFMSPSQMLVKIDTIISKLLLWDTMIQSTFSDMKPLKGMMILKLPCDKITYIQIDVDKFREKNTTKEYEVNLALIKHANIILNRNIIVFGKKNSDIVIGNGITDRLVELRDEIYRKIIEDDDFCFKAGGEKRFEKKECIYKPLHTAYDLYAYEIYYDMPAVGKQTRSKTVNTTPVVTSLQLLQFNVVETFKVTGDPDIDNDLEYGKGNFTDVLKTIRNRYDPAYTSENASTAASSRASPALLSPRSRSQSRSPLLNSPVSPPIGGPGGIDGVPEFPEEILVRSQHDVAIGDGAYPWWDYTTAEAEQNSKLYLREAGRKLENDMTVERLRTRIDQCDDMEEIGQVAHHTVRLDVDKAIKSGGFDFYEKLCMLILKALRNVVLKSVRNRDLLVEDDYVFNNYNRHRLQFFTCECLNIYVNWMIQDHLKLNTRKVAEDVLFVVLSQRLELKTVVLQAYQRHLPAIRKIFGGLVRRELIDLLIAGPIQA